MYHWDKKFASASYLYGTEANAYIKAQFKQPIKQPKKVVILAEGEGRNAVYLAQLGYDVTTYDLSKVGIEKQQKLAKEKSVHIDARYGDITTKNLTDKNLYDFSINIFGHVREAEKQAMFNNLVHALKPNGHSYFEVYAVDQLNYQTGGPKDPDLLYQLDKVRAYLQQLPVKIHTLENVVVTRQEGNAHHGEASVIQGHIEKL